MPGPECNWTDELQKLADAALLIAYYICMPLYFVIGISGNTILLLAFYKQAKKEKAYAYQIFLALSKICEIFFFSLFTATYKWCAGIEYDVKADWFQKSYPLMFFAVHLSCPLFLCFLMISLFISVSMTADRIFALTKPFTYKNINHRRHQIVAVSVCCIICVLCNVPAIMHLKLEFHNDTSKYKGILDEEYNGTPMAMALGHLRTGIRFVGIIALIVLNVVMVMAFRKRIRKVGQMTDSDSKEKKRRAEEKVLLILSVWQSVLICAALVPHSIHLIIEYASVKYLMCYGGTLAAPLVDTIIQVGDAIDIFVLIAINKRIRRSVLRVFPCYSPPAITTVGTGTGLVSQPG